MPIRIDIGGIERRRKTAAPDDGPRKPRVRPNMVVEVKEKTRKPPAEPRPYFMADLKPGKNR